MLFKTKIKLIFYST